MHLFYCTLIKYLSELYVCIIYGVNAVFVTTSTTFVSTVTSVFQCDRKYWLLLQLSTERQQAKLWMWPLTKPTTLARTRKLTIICCDFFPSFCCIPVLVVFWRRVEACMADVWYHFHSTTAVRGCLFIRITRGLSLRSVQTLTFDLLASNKLGDQDLSSTIHLPSLTCPLVV